MGEWGVNLESGVVLLVGDESLDLGGETDGVEAGLDDELGLGHVLEDAEVACELGVIGLEVGGGTLEDAVELEDALPELEDVSPDPEELIHRRHESLVVRLGHELNVPIL